MQKKVKFIDGLSESTWKSLVVKSIRIGWLEGILEAEKRLPKSTMQNLLIAGLFEDVFPAGYDELNEAAKEIKNRDYEALLSRQTHHGREGMTKIFCDFEQESVARMKIEGNKISAIVRASAPEIGFIIPRVFNCLYTWYYVLPSDKGKKRTVLKHPFSGIPFPIMDPHTYEGRRMGQKYNYLSGAYERHYLLGQEVTANGWENVRERFVNEDVKPLTQQTLF